MADTPQAGPPLEELVDAYVDGMKDTEEGPSVSIYDLEEALKARLELAGGPTADVDKLIRTGAALTRFGDFARRLRAGLELERAAVDAEGLEAMDAAAMRDELAIDLTYAINAAGSFEECSVLERAKAIRNLTEAYVRLGGEVSIPLPPPLEAKVGRIDLTGIADEAMRVAWHTASEAGATPDSIAGAVRASILSDEDGGQ